MKPLVGGHGPGISRSRAESGWDACPEVDSNRVDPDLTRFLYWTQCYCCETVRIKKGGLSSLFIHSGYEHTIDTRVKCRASMRNMKLAHKAGSAV